MAAAGFARPVMVNGGRLRASYPAHLRPDRFCGPRCQGTPGVAQEAAGVGWGLDPV